MSRHRERALLLKDRNRPDEAIREFHGALTEDPGDATAHACLAILHAQCRAWKQANDHAQQAVALSPDRAFSHKAMAIVFFHRNRFDQAASAITEAIRLDPHDADLFRLLAAIHLSTADYTKALKAADDGLAIDPEHPGCTTLRSRSLLLLGDREAAAATIDEALRRKPDDSAIHATQGWAMLHAADPQRAIAHFREALRTDPEGRYARLGIVAALKARNPVYCWLLACFLRTRTTLPVVRWLLVVGGVVAAEVIAERWPTNPTAAWILGIVFSIYGIFATLTWVGDPAFDLLLFLDPVGRHALNGARRRRAILSGSLLTVALIAATVGMATGSSAAILVAIQWALTAVVATTIHACDDGWPRATMGILVMNVTAMAITTTVMALAGTAFGMNSRDILRFEHVRASTGVFFFSWFVAMIVSVFMTGRRVRH
ncbi:MAG: tetratricopeptide repeat protein [Planctomycetia bacterium]